MNVKILNFVRKLLVIVNGSGHSKYCTQSVLLIIKIIIMKYYSMAMHMEIKSTKLIPYTLL